MDCNLRATDFPGFILNIAKHLEVNHVIPVHVFHEALWQVEVLPANELYFLFFWFCLMVLNLVLLNFNQT